MSEFTVQIEYLEPMRVAIVTVTRASPEQEAVDRLLDWAASHGLLDQAYRFFGYDNCEADPNHTYTTWLTVESTVQPSDDIQIIDFAGGRYAVTELEGVEQISPRWKQLEQWVTDNGYVFADQMGLEEHLDVGHLDGGHLGKHGDHSRRFKLYMPIKD